MWPEACGPTISSLMVGLVVGGGVADSESSRFHPSPSLAILLLYSIWYTALWLYSVWFLGLSFRIAFCFVLHVVFSKTNSNLAIIRECVEQEAISAPFSHFRLH